MYFYISQDPINIDILFLSNTQVSVGKTLKEKFDQALAIFWAELCQAKFTRRL